MGVEACGIFVDQGKRISIKQRGVSRPDPGAYATKRQTVELPCYNAATAITVQNIQMSLAYWELFYGHIE